MTGLFYFTMVVFIVVCVFLILLILIQKGRGGGLASAFGGAGGQTAFGSKTGDVLTWATSVVFGIFVILAVCLNLIANNINNKKLAAAAALAAIPQASPALPSIPETPETPPASPPTTVPQSPATMPSLPTTLFSVPPGATTNLTGSDSVPFPTTTVIGRVPVKTVFPTTAPRAGENVDLSGAGDQILLPTSDPTTLP